jgi:putative flavoprotein involved in K+ transport
VLFTSARYDSLPGLPFPAEADSYPTKDDVADYLAAYVERFSLPLRSASRVTSVSRSSDAYVATTVADDQVEARRVVVATGPFQIPSVPGVAGALAPSITQVHSDAYRSPAAIPGDGPVLVVGGGNSGCQIAQELSASRPVTLALGSRSPVLPQRPLGRDLWWWGEKLGVSKVTVESRLGRRLRGRDPVIGVGPKRLARDHDIVLRPRVRGVSDGVVTFADGSGGAFDGVVWATGYAVDHSWVDVPEAKGADGRLAHRRGVTAADGLFVIGQSWQWRRGSALLGWVGDDAAYLVGQMG